MFSGGTFGRWLDCEGAILISGFIYCWVHWWMCCWEVGPGRRGGVTGGVTWKGVFFPGAPSFLSTFWLQCVKQLSSDMPTMLDTSHIGLWHNLLSHFDLIILFRDLSSKYSHILKYWSLRLQHKCLEELNSLTSTYFSALFLIFKLALLLTS